MRSLVRTGISPWLGVLAPALLLLGAGLAVGCPYSIRDSGFIVRDPEPYRLVVLTKGATEIEVAQTREALKKAAAQVLDHANLQVSVVEATRSPDDPVVQKLPELGLTAETAAGQAVLYSPRDQRALLLKQSAGQDAATVYQALLRQVVTSPVREALIADLIQAWCVVLVVPGAEAAENEAVAKAAATAAGKLVGFEPEMGEKIRQAPPVVTVRRDDPKEEILRWSLGVEQTGTPQAQVIVIFGMGRRVGPVLRGAQATAGRVTELLRLLGKNCTCTSDPSWFLGPALPVNWSRARQQEVRDALGFDPNSPAVADTLSGVWRTLRQPNSAVTAGEAVPDPNTGYVEFSVEPDTNPPAEEPAQNEGAGDGDEGAELEQRSWRAAYVVGGALTTVALGGTVFLMWRSRRRG